MEIYFKNSKGQIEETNLKGLLILALINAGFEMENGRFEGENHNWIGIVQESKKPSRVVTNICFEDDGNTITGLKVFEAPIKTIVEEDNSKQVI